MNPERRNNLGRLQPGWLSIAAAIGVSVWLVVLGSFSTRYTSFGSPDEAANALMARTYADTNEFRLRTSLRPDELAAFHPRSLFPSGQDLLPGSFLGFILIQGAVARLGPHAPSVFTIILFGVALWAFYRIARRYWSVSWSIAAVALLSTLPPVAIFQTLTWFQAGLYTSLLLITGLALLRFQEQPAFARAVALGLIYGLALSIRPVEFLFTGPIIAVVMTSRSRGWLKLLVTATMVAVTQLPWIVAGKRLFGSYLASGYAPGGLPTEAETTGGDLSWLNVVLPPSGWSWHFINAIWEGIILALPAISAMAIIATLYYLRRKFISWKKVIKLGAIIIFIGYYLAYYGSLDLYPNVPSIVGFQSSYLRYWLPLVAGLAAGVVVFFKLVSVWLGRGVWLMVTLVVITNAYLTIKNVSGLARQERRLNGYSEIAANMERLTEPDSLILARQYDKILVGRRNVSYFEPTSEQSWELLRNISRSRPVYVIGRTMSWSEKQLGIEAARHRLAAEIAGEADGAPLWRLTPTPI